MKTISTQKYIGIYIASLVLLIFPPLVMFITLFIAEESYKIKFSDGLYAFGFTIAGLCVLQYLIIQIGIYFWLLVKMWKPLQDGQTPVSVAKAIGFSLIPIFRLYWLFIAWGSYPKEYNNFIQRHRIPVKPLSGVIFNLVPVCLLASFLLVFPLVTIPFITVGMILKVTQANNALAGFFNQGQAEF